MEERGQTDEPVWEEEEENDEEEEGTQRGRTTTGVGPQDSA